MLVEVVGERKKGMMGDFECGDREGMVRMGIGGEVKMDGG